MCVGSEFQVNREWPRGEVTSDAGRSGQKICVGRTQGSGWKIVGD